MIIKKNNKSGKDKAMAVHINVPYDIPVNATGHKIPTNKIKKLILDTNSIAYECPSNIFIFKPIIDWLEFTYDVKNEEVQEYIASAVVAEATGDVEGYYKSVSLQDQNKRRYWGYKINLYMTDPKTGIRLSATCNVMSFWF